MTQTLISIDNLQVKTPTGYQKSDGLLITKKQKVIELYFNNETYLKCTLDHKILTKNGWVEAKDIKLGDNVIDEFDEETFLIYKEVCSELEDVYDLVNVQNGNQFFSNNKVVKNCIVLDEFGFIPPNVAENFFASVYPTISSGKTTKMIVISTPNGMNMFYKLWTDGLNGRNDYVPVQANWFDVPGRDENFKKQTIANTDYQKWLQEYECLFLGSQNTLISTNKLACLPFIKPIHTEEYGLEIYEKPKPTRIYGMFIDTSLSIGKDYNAITVVDITDTPYKVVAKYRSNQIQPQVFPNIIAKIGNFYNEAHTLIELNGNGVEIANILHNDLEYPNIIRITNKSGGSKGQFANGGFGGGSTTPGVRMSAQIKSVACSILKDMVEMDKILIPDFDIISELSTFILKSKGTSKGSYEADIGKNDDLVSSLLLFCWLTTQEYFKDITNSDIRKKLYEQKLREIDESVPFFGFVEDQETDSDDLLENRLIFEGKQAIDIDKIS